MAALRMAALKNSLSGWEKFPDALSADRRGFPRKNLQGR